MLPVGERTWILCSSRCIVYPCITRTSRIGDDSRSLHGVSVGSSAWPTSKPRDPREVAERGLELSGMDYVQAIFAGELPPPPIAELMGFRGVEAEPGRARLRDGAGAAALQPDRLGARRRRADAARLGDGLRGAHAARAGVGYTTLEVKTNFVRPITAGHRPDPLRGHRDPQGARASRPRRGSSPTPPGSSSRTGRRPA